MKSPFAKKKKRFDRRNPTSPTPKATAYHYSARRADVERTMDRTSDQPNSGDRRKRFRVGQIPVLLSAMLVLAGVVYLSSLTTEPQIVINGKRDLLRDEAAITQEATRLLESSLINRSKLTINTERLQAELASAFPEFSSVEVITPIIRHKPVVNVTLAQPTALLSNGKGVYLLDENGRALFDIEKQKPSFDTTTLPLVQDKTQTPITLGKPALTRAQISFIHEVVKQSAPRQLSVSTMDLVAGGGELDVQFEGLPYFVKFNFFEDARKSSGTFFAIKERLELENKPPTEYIDVRIPERAYVK